MVHYLITCRSLTYAQKAARTLERTGITASIIRAPKGISREGCAYCVKVSERRGREALAILRQTNTPFNRIFLQHASGEMREVAL
ncbi:MAG: DUF3343 domain-containing protein [Oscillospiraceae bacterium]|nr:DUF3343 domain-containing protein [Oscillospiraceae bacterium]